MIVMLCCAHFLFWYGLHVADDSTLSRFMRPYETWDSINHDNPARRIAVRNRLAEINGPLLVFVRYFPQHVFQEEWVFNAADIDASRIVWARDLGPAENRALMNYYPKRRALLLEPDHETPEISDYQEEAPKPEEPQARNQAGNKAVAPLRRGEVIPYADAPHTDSFAPCNAARFSPTKSRLRRRNSPPLNRHSVRRCWSMALSMFQE